MPTELRLAHTRERELNLKVLTAGRCRAGISQTLPLSSTSKKTTMLVIETAVVKTISSPQLGPAIPYFGTADSDPVREDFFCSSLYLNCRQWLLAYQTDRIYLP